MDSYEDQEKSIRRAKNKDRKAGDQIAWFYGAKTPTTGQVVGKQQNLFIYRTKSVKTACLFFFSFGCMSVDNSQILLPANKLDIQSPAVYGVYQGSRISTRDRKKRKQ